MNAKFAPHDADPRRAGRIFRYHTWPYTAAQSVGEHCWQLARILYAIWPEVPAQMIRHALFHDVGEVGTGDMPYPTKRMIPALKVLMNDLEDACHLSMCLPWGVPPPLHLSDEDQRVFKLAEYIEMWEKSLDEVAAGNAEFRVVVTICHEQIDLILARLYPERTGCAQAATAYVLKRTSRFSDIVGRDYTVMFNPGVHHVVD